MGARKRNPAIGKSCLMFLIVTVLNVSAGAHFGDHHGDTLLSIVRSAEGKPQPHQRFSLASTSWVLKIGQEATLVLYGIETLLPTRTRVLNLKTRTIGSTS